MYNYANAISKVCPPLASKVVSTIADSFNLSISPPHSASIVNTALSEYLLVPVTNIAGVSPVSAARVEVYLPDDPIPTLQRKVAASKVKSPSVAEPVVISVLIALDKSFSCDFNEAFILDKLEIISFIKAYVPHVAVATFDDLAKSAFKFKIVSVASL